HGERDPLGVANHDLGSWGKTLEEKGLKVQRLNLGNTPMIPANIAALVVAAPQTALLPGEQRLIRDYLQRGGNLLWLADTGSELNTVFMGEWLGVKLIPGVVVDPTTQLVSINNAAIALASRYGTHAITQGFDKLTAYPYAKALDVAAVDKGLWQATPLLWTASGSWAEQSTIVDQVAFDENTERHGPLTLAVAMERTVAAPPDSAAVRQRIVVVGDSDFLSNSYVGNGGNLELGMRIVDWQSQNEQFIAIAPKVARDVTLQLDKVQAAFISIGLLIVMPVLLLLMGGIIRWRRQRMGRER
ncbi:MAG: hypothetical protein FD130_1282, partial [Halothiobacillaceae bacterium]